MDNAGEDIPLPPHTYVPGKTVRHPDGLFDEIKDSVRPDTPLENLGYTRAWRTGMRYFETGYFWEAHEVWEAIWLRTPEGSVQRDMAQAVIQLANARLKVRMGRDRAAERLCDMVLEHLDRCPDTVAILGLKTEQVRDWTAQTRRTLNL